MVIVVDHLQDLQIPRLLRHPRLLRLPSDLPHPHVHRDETDMKIELSLSFIDEGFFVGQMAQVRPWALSI